MIYADNLTAYEKGVLLSIAALSTEPEIVLAGDGISEMTEEERKKIWEQIAKAFAEYDTGKIEQGLESLENVILSKEEQQIYEQTYAFFMDFAYEEGAA